MNMFKSFSLIRRPQFWQAGVLVSLLVLMTSTTPALAHHAMGGSMPTNFFEGFLSGMAHPLIGLDHFAFIIAIGLLAATRTQGFLILVAFVLTAMLGTALHLGSLNIPGSELFVSGSILIFGMLLAMKDRLHTAVISALAGVAGLFHGFAYGEAIFGAETTPLVAYLTGFTVVQLGVSLAAMWVGQTIARGSDRQSLSMLEKLRAAGLVILGIGLALFVPQVIEIVFPVTSA